MNYLVSVCIPCYNQTEFLKKTLDSLCIQSYKNFEVVITDDSSSTNVKELVHSYADKFTINYFKNPVALGSPANWNKALDLAKGELIKIIHHDDWLANEDSLKEFVNVFENDKTIDFVFCASEIHNIKEGTVSYNSPAEDFIQAIKKDPKVLYNDNRIGAPTATMFKATTERFDVNMKYLVDLDFYIRMLQKSKGMVYIPCPLIVNTSHHLGQVTAASMNKETQVGENCYLYNKLYKGKIPGKKLSLYFIRLFKFYKIKTLGEIKQFSVLPEPVWYFRCLIILSKIKS